jgi:NAD(P)-dependent dehydrogenase (short-subunit alcohol dehydrogenase family)
MMAAAVGVTTDREQPRDRTRIRDMTIYDAPTPDYGSLLRLDGRGFAVLGAGNGIGRQTAIALASQGARVLCVDVDRGRAEDVAAEVDGVAHEADVTRSDDVLGVVEAAQRELGRFDGVADVIGLHVVGALVDLSDDDWDFCHDICARQAFHVVRHAGRALAARGGGTIVFVSSVSGLTSSPYTGAYGAAKSALTSLVKTAAIELRDRDVRVNAVAPGVIATPRTAGRAGRPAAELATGSLTGLGAPSDIASAILFLASDLARYVTGHTLVVDGGAMVQFPFDIPPPPPGVVSERGA